jgi:hypothetical protein
MNTLADLLAREAELTDEARAKYGPYLATALHGCGFLSSGIAKIDDDRFLFGAMHALVCKHMLLAALSYVRRHRVQGSMNLRQVVESAQRGCYYLAHPTKHVKETETAIVVDEKGVKDLTYHFFNESMKDHAEAFRQGKRIINMTDAHASLRSALLIFKQGAVGRDLFFDAENPVMVRVGLWSVINTTVGVLDAYHLASAQFGGVQFADDFEARFAEILGMRERLHEELWGEKEVQDLEQSAVEDDA